MKQELKELLEKLQDEINRKAFLNYDETQAVSNESIKNCREWQVLESLYQNVKNTIDDLNFIEKTDFLKPEKLPLTKEILNRIKAGEKELAKTYIDPKQGAKYPKTSALTEEEQETYHLNLAQRTPTESDVVKKMAKSIIGHALLVELEKLGPPKTSEPN